MTEWSTVTTYEVVILHQFCRAEMSKSTGVKMRCWSPFEEAQRNGQPWKRWSAKETVQQINVAWCWLSLQNQKISSSARSSAAKTNGFSRHLSGSFVFILLCLLQLPVSHQPTEYLCVEPPHLMFIFNPIHLCPSQRKSSSLPLK